VLKRSPQEITRTVGRRIAELRHERMTQADFAEAMGTSIQWVSRVETGENLTLITMDKIANVLGISIKDLFEEPRKETLVAKRGRPRKK
jgi:transcriptional regulator with XRE-family HTH domain